MMYLNTFKVFNLFFIILHQFYILYYVSRSFFEIPVPLDFNDIVHINKDFNVVYEYAVRFLVKSMVPTLLSY